MPVACGGSVLTGADGLVEFSPAGVNQCLLDNTDFPAGTAITMPAGHGFKAGDPIAFVAEGSATLDSKLTASQEYVVAASGPASVSVAEVLTPTLLITLDGDGGTGAADTGGAANHILATFARALPVCSVQEWNLSLTKETTDVTTLPCSVGTSGSKVAPVRKQQGTFLSGDGSMSLLFTGDTTSMGQRLLADSVMVDSMVMAKLYVNAVAGVGGTVDDVGSSYFQGKVNLLGFEITVNTSDALVATVNFSLADTPIKLFGVTL